MDDLEALEALFDIHAACVNPDCSCKQDDLTRALHKGEGGEDVHVKERPSGLLIPSVDKEVPVEFPGNYL